MPHITSLKDTAGKKSKKKTKMIFFDHLPFPYLNTATKDLGAV